MKTIETIKKVRYILTKREVRDLSILALGIIVMSVLETFGIGIIIPILNLCLNLQKIQSSFLWDMFAKFTGSHDPLVFLSLLIWVAVALFIGKAIFSVYMLYREQVLSFSVMNRLTAAMLQSYLDKPYVFHLENNSASLFNNLNAEVGQFATGYLSSIVKIGSEIAIILGVFLLLMWVYPLVTISLVGVFVVLMLAMNALFKRKVVSYSQERFNQSERKYKIALESLQAVKEIKVYNASSFFMKGFHSALKEYMKNFVKFNVISNLPRYILETLLFVCALLVLLVNIRAQRDFTQFIPMMMVMGLAAMKLLPSINKIYTYINQVHFSANSLDLVYNTLCPGHEADVSERSRVERSGNSVAQEDSIYLDGVTFAYANTPKPIFRNLSLSIPLNKTVAFLGSTGAGKSTLIDIVMGLLVPSQGRLWYRSEVVDENSVISYRHRVGYVPQQILLLDDTLESNIAFGIPEDVIDRKRVDDVVRIAQLSDFVASLKLGIKSVVGERGVRLSGGQRQRIGIARALYRNPEILVMDEATSSLDGRTEAEVSRAIAALSGKLTVIIIAHRLTTIEHADLIYVMQDGVIVDQGAFSDLASRSEAFKKITNHKVDF